MQNSNKFEKANASRGILVFAFNTPEVDYVSIADKASALANNRLKLPITLVTDDSGQPTYNFDRVIRISNSDSSNIRTNLNGDNIVWKNFGRYLAYKLSPYDETLLLDTDYLVMNDNLNKLFETDFAYKLMHHNQTVTGPSYEQMGETSLPYVWATVVAFRKTEKAKQLFDLVGLVQRNYNYYRALYNVREGNYRNDYAFAMANNIINGYSPDDTASIPWTMFTVDTIVNEIERVGSLFKVKGEKSTIVAPNIDMHVMDKDYLQSANFAALVKDLCAA